MSINIDQTFLSLVQQLQQLQEDLAATNSHYEGDYGNGYDSGRHTSADRLGEILETFQPVIDAITSEPANDEPATMAEKIVSDLRYLQRDVNRMISNMNDPEYAEDFKIQLVTKDLPFAKGALMRVETSIRLINGK